MSRSDTALAHLDSYLGPYSRQPLSYPALAASLVFRRPFTGIHVMFADDDLGRLVFEKGICRPLPDLTEIGTLTSHSSNYTDI